MMASSGRSRGGSGRDFPTKEVFLTKLLKEKAYPEVLSWNYQGRPSELLALSKALVQDETTFDHIFAELASRGPSSSARPSSYSSKPPQTREEVTERLIEIMKSNLNLVPTTLELTVHLHNAASFLGHAMAYMQLALARCGDKETIIKFRKRLRRLLSNTPKEDNLATYSLILCIGLALGRSDLRFEYDDYQAWWSCFADDPTGLTESCVEDVLLFSDFALTFLNVRNRDAVMQKTVIRLLALLAAQNMTLARGPSPAGSLDLRYAQADLPESIEKKLHRPLRTFHDSIKRSNLLRAMLIDTENIRELFARIPEYFADRIDCAPLEDLLSEIYATTQDLTQFNEYVGSLHYILRHEFARHALRLRQILIRAGTSNQAIDFVGYLSTVTANLAKVSEKVFNEGRRDPTWIPKYVSRVTLFTEFLTLQVPKHGIEYQRLACEAMIKGILAHIDRLRPYIHGEEVPVVLQLVMLLGYLLSPMFEPDGFDEFNFEHLEFPVAAVIEFFAHVMREEVPDDLSGMFNAFRYLAPYVELSAKSISDFTVALDRAFRGFEHPGSPARTREMSVSIQAALLFVLVAQHRRVNPQQFGRYSQPKLWGNMCVQVLEEWERSTSSPHAIDTFNIDDWVNVFEAMTEVSYIEDAFAFAPMISKSTSTPSKIVKDILASPRLRASMYDVDVLLGQYMLLIGNVASDVYKRGRGAAQVDAEFVRALGNIETILAMKPKNLLQVPNALFHLPFALGNLACSPNRDRVAGSVLRLVVRLKEDAGRRPDVLLQEFVTVDALHLTMFSVNLCFAISNCCAAAWVSNGGDESRLFYKMSIDFVLTVVVAGWFEDASAFSALRNLAQSSPDNCLMLIDFGGIDILLHAYINLREANAKRDLDHLSRLIRVARKNTPTADAQNKWTEAIKRISQQFTETELASLEPRESSARS